MDDHETESNSEAMLEMIRIVMAQMFALRAAVTALLRTHSQGGEVLVYFDFIAESLRATLLNSQWSETRLDEFETNISALRKDITHQFPEAK